MALCRSNAVKAGLTTMLLFTVLLVISISCVYAQTCEPDVVITIDSNGAVYVELNSTAELGVNFFECPVEPILATIEASVDDEPVPTIYYNNSIVVVSSKIGSIKVSYIANVTFEGGVVSFYYSLAREATLIIPPNIILMPGDLTLIDARVRDGKLFLRFKGPGNISFVVGETGKLGPEPSPAPSTPTTVPLIGLEMILYAVIVVAALGAIVVVRKRRREPLATYLDEVDKAIIEKLRKHGGETLQSALYKELSFPKATVWRHIKKLEKVGYVTVERIGRDNKVKLLK